MKKEPRITYLGETWPPKKQPRNKKGEYHKRSVLPYVSMALVVVFIGFIGKYGAIKAEYVNTHVANAAVLDDGIEPITPADIEAKKDAVVDTILKCEAAGHSEDDAIIIYDNNSRGTLKGKNVYSLGQLQFKVSTIQTYAKMRDGSVLTQKEAVMIALDSEKARELAKWVIFETKGGYANWLNCSNKFNIPAKVEAIKSLEKQVSI